MSDHRISDQGRTDLAEEGRALDNPRANEVIKPPPIPAPEPVAPAAPRAPRKLQIKVTTPVATRARPQGGAARTPGIPSQQEVPVARPAQVAVKKIESRQSRIKPQQEPQVPAARPPQVAAKVAPQPLASPGAFAQAPPMTPRSSQLVTSGPQNMAEQVLSQSPAFPKQAAPLRPSKTASELARMIELDIANAPDCPAQGLRITVYGGTSRWRAMLTITPAAGAVRDAQYLRQLTDDLAERLRLQYDLAWE